MAPTLYQKWTLTSYLFFFFFFFFFVKNLNISCSSDYTFLFKFHQHVANAYKGIYGETSLTMFR